MTNIVTNIVLSVVVSIVTNVSHTDNSIPAFSHYDARVSDNWGNVTPLWTGTPATEKTITTEIVRVTRLSFAYAGKTYHGEETEVLSTDIQRWRKRETWEASE